MPSPFPGMDPYLESWIWGDFHRTMITALRAQLNAKMPRRYVANTELYVWRVDPTEQERLVIDGPDVHVADQKPSANFGTATASLPAPITTVFSGIERKQHYVRIVDAAQRRIVTVVELLSPSNKSTHERGDAYRFKRNEYMANGVNFIEIDFLRAGLRPALGDPAPPISDYYVLVSRSENFPKLDIWPISIRDALPRIPVPLDAGEPEVILDLRSAFDRVYEEARYGEQLDYTAPPILALREPDASWARDLLASRL
jgi:Protein of unknown function (DUF4058)